ncbi:MAG: hypothetical protein NWF14_00905 [Candidatus Bathyarchaeota archaeon]|nr:hypothetical protein [Candidatus Bathyarchaeota archaeon]
MTKYKVTAILAGHEHLYYRTDYKGVPFITLGGGRHYTENWPETEKAKEKEMQMLISEHLRPYICKIEPNKKNREMVDV